MNILVCVKRVVDVELNIRVAEGKIVEDGLQYVMSGWDEVAVEAAVSYQEEHGGEVTCVSIGGEDTTEVIRKALAMGASKGIHVNDSAINGSDSFGIAKILAKVVQQGNYDLIMMGRQAQDTDSGQVSPILAEILSIPIVGNAVSMDKLNDNALKVSRNGDEGKEEIELQLPAIVTTNDSFNEPRLPSLRGIMMAKKKEIQTLDLNALGIDSNEVGTQPALSQIKEYTTPESKQAGKKFEGDAEEITREVVQLLSNEAKVI